MTDIRNLQRGQNGPLQPIYRSEWLRTTFDVDQMSWTSYHTQTTQSTILPVLYSLLPGLHPAVKMILLLSYLTNEVVVTKCLWELLVLILGVQVDCLSAVGCSPNRNLEN